MTSRSKPRGFFTDQSHLAWSTDKSKNYLEGAENIYFWPAVKTAVVSTIFYNIFLITDSLAAAAVVCITITMYQQHAIALFHENTKVIPTLDQASFASNEHAICNFMIANFYNTDDLEFMKERWAKSVRMYAKLRYKIKFIHGDPYYEEMSIDEAMKKIFIEPSSSDKVLRSQKDIDMYIEDNLNIKLPNDGPLVRYYFQRYEPTDMDHIAPEKRPKMFMMTKIHHALADGVSSACIPLAMSDEFDRSYFSKAKDATFIQRALIRIMMPFQIVPFLLMGAVSADSNSITKQRDAKGLSGKLNISSSPGLDLEAVKSMAKAKGATINDAILSAFLTSMQSAFQDFDDEKMQQACQDMGKNTPKSINVGMPANIRFKFYGSREEVRLQNKFTGLMVQTPLSSKLDLQSVKAITNRVKGAIGIIYAGYASSRQVFKLTPRFLHQFMTSSLSKKTTAFFSNTPGCSKPLRYTNSKTGSVTLSENVRSYIQPGGEVGFGLCALSWCGNLNISLNTDENVLSREMNQKLIATMHQLLLNEIEASNVTKEQTTTTSTQVQSGSDGKSQDAQPRSKKMD